ncbi:hypothetical protein BC567DRAFT_68832 [Phyllosticta citribraziliensis]
MCFGITCFACVVTRRTLFRACHELYKNTSFALWELNAILVLSQTPKYTCRTTHKSLDSSALPYRRSAAQRSEFQTKRKVSCHPTSCPVRHSAHQPTRRPLNPAGMDDHSRRMAPHPPRRAPSTDPDSDATQRDTSPVQAGPYTNQHGHRRRYRHRSSRQRLLYRNAKPVSVPMARDAEVAAIWKWQWQ